MPPDFDVDALLGQVAHRPYPLPTRPWLMTQSWHDLLFAHWSVDVEMLRRSVPGAFELDLFDGRAWLGIVPFFMTNVAPRGVPPIPWLSEFAELNVRTYVRVGDTPGIYFFSLDAARAAAVVAARATLNLPYFMAAMQVTRDGAVVHYQSRRRRERGRARLTATYEPIGPVFQPVAGTREHFLTERYCLYHLDHQGRPYRLDIHHPPWSLQTARASFGCNTMAEGDGLALPASTPLLHFVKRQDMVAYPPTSLSR